MGASRSRKPGRRRARRSCKPPRGGAGALGLPRGEANSFAACLSFPWGKDRPPSLQSEGGLGWHEKVACGQGDCLPDALATLSFHQGAALVYPLQLALQLEGVAGSRRRRGGVGTRRIFGGRHRGPWPWPRCWGRLSEGRWGPSPTKLKPGRGCASPSHPLAPTLLGPLAPPKLRGWGTVERPRKGWKWFGPFPNAFDQAP